MVKDMESDIFNYWFYSHSSSDDDNENEELNEDGQFFKQKMII